MATLFPVLIIVAIIVLIIFVWLFVNLFVKRTVNKCPNCESTDMVEISRKVIDTNTVEQQGGGFGGGGDIRVQSVAEITYRCNSCQQNSTVTVRKTN